MFHIYIYLGSTLKLNKCRTLLLGRSDANRTRIAHLKRMVPKPFGHASISPVDGTSAGPWSRNPQIMDAAGRIARPLPLLAFSLETKRRESAALPIELSRHLMAPPRRVELLFLGWKPSVLTARRWRHFYTNGRAANRTWVSSLRTKRSIELSTNLKTGGPAESRIRTETLRTSCATVITTGPIK